MRLHRLEVTAFGPFAGTEQVDFDSLSDAGLFLLCGPTGGGKTSVLDAVSFALFGQVPGERDKAKRLRSDHAPPGTGPRVTLEVTLRARRLRITRSPEWTRPKKRGSGSMREPAKVLLEEHVDGHWHQHTNRIDEAADLLGDLVGMTAGQFCQVALLPQGCFETFLRAGGQERHSLLERLFDTQRFRAIEDWLAERRTALGRTRAEHETTVGTIVARIAEASGQQPRCGDDGRPVLEDSLLAWSARLRDGVVAALTSTRAERVQADLVVKRALGERDDARARADLQARHADAVARQERLTALADDTAALAQRAAAARRAEAVQPVAGLYDEAEARTRSARADARSAIDGDGDQLPAAVHRRLAGLRTLQRPTGWCDDVLSEAAHAAHADAVRLGSLLPLRDELDDIDARRDSTSRDIGDLVQRQEEAARIRASRQQRRAELQQRVDAHETIAHGVEARRQQLEAAEARLTAATAVVDAERRRRVASTDAGLATERALTARERWLDARQRRLDGMAAELAHGLTTDAPCPVCGACDHPAPAEISGPRVTADDEQRAERHFQDLERARAGLDAELRECETALATAAAGADGLDVPAATIAREQAAAELRAASAARHEAAALTERLRQLDAEETAAAGLDTRLEADLATLRERSAQLRSRRVELSETLATAIGDAHSLTARLQQAQATERAATEICARVTAWRDAHTEQVARRRRLDDALRSQGFTDLTTARAAALPTTEISNLEAVAADRAAEERQVRELLDDPAARAAVAEPAVDLDDLEHRLVELGQVRDAAVATESELARQADRLERLHSELDSALAAWRPVRAAHRTAGSLAALCAGTSADNPDRVRLSGYVLAARLAQVVDAANERLDKMTGGRYLLEHSDARGVGDRRGGLGLRVRDGWTGQSRDPATLSGGETFIASLALALGLADVVAYEAGGAEVATLFVDEGFGLLDADSLDEVMDVLDSLRSGGRVVGLVSHVAELRVRVGTQVRVSKTRHGSTLAQL